MRHHSLPHKADRNDAKEKRDGPLDKPECHCRDHHEYSDFHDKIFERQPVDKRSRFPQHCRANKSRNSIDRAELAVAEVKVRSDVSAYD